MIIYWIIVVIFKYAVFVFVIFCLWFFFFFCMKANRTVNAIILYKGAWDFVERMNVIFFFYNVTPAPSFS